MTVQSPIFAPAIALVLWSLVMLAWLAMTRLPAMGKAGISLTTAVGSRGVNLEGVVPDSVHWKSHNYTHLMEQPTLFYVTVVILGLAGAGGGLNLQLAWAYVILRIDTRDQRTARNALNSLRVTSSACSASRHSERRSGRARAE